MLGLTPSSLAISETVFEPRAIRRRTASFLNESGRIFLCCIGGTPRRIIPSGMFTKAGQAHLPRALSLCLEQAKTETVATALRHIIEDEVRHARIGWAVLASDKLSDADRRVISNRLPSL